MLKILKILYRVNRWSLLKFLYVKLIKIKYGVVAHPNVEIIEGYNAKIVFGKNIYLSEGVKIIAHPNSKIILGEASRYAENCRIESRPFEAIIIGERSSLQINCHISGEVEIGCDCLFAPNVFVSSGNHIFENSTLTIKKQDENYFHENGFYHSEKIEIGNDIWVGINSVILPGVKIEDKSIVGANSVVTKSVPKYEIKAGVPAIKIGSRSK